jgi:hypothetical protein
MREAGISDASGWLDEKSLVKTIPTNSQGDEGPRQRLTNRKCGVALGVVVSLCLNGCSGTSVKVRDTASMHMDPNSLLTFAQLKGSLGDQPKIVALSDYSNVTTATWPGNDGSDLLIVVFKTEHLGDSDLPYSMVFGTGFLGSVCGIHLRDGAQALERLAAEEGDDPSITKPPADQNVEREVNLYRFSGDFAAESKSPVELYRFASFQQGIPDVTGGSMTSPEEGPVDWDGWVLKKYRDRSLALTNYACSTTEGSVGKKRIECTRRLKRVSKQFRIIENKLVVIDSVTQQFSGANPSELPSAVQGDFRRGLSQGLEGVKDLNSGRAAYAGKVGEAASMFPSPAGLTPSQVKLFSEARASLAMAGHECATAFGAISKTADLSAVSAFRSHYARCGRLVDLVEKNMKAIEGAVDSKDR